jgi:hypothetical protein
MENDMFSSTEKFQINHRLSEVSRHFLTTPQNALVLDHDDAKTTKALRKQFKHLNITVPNFDTNTCRAIKTQVPSCNVVHGSLNQTLQTIDKKLDIVFFDYCSSLQEDVIQDVELLFQRDLLADSVVLAVTVSQRNFNANHVGDLLYQRGVVFDTFFQGKSSFYLQSLVQFYSFRYGYQCRCLVDLPYNHGIIFQMYLLHRGADLLPSVPKPVAEQVKVQPKKVIVDDDITFPSSIVMYEQDRNGDDYTYYGTLLKIKRDAPKYFVVKWDSISRLQYVKKSDQGVRWHFI